MNILKKAAAVALLISSPGLVYTATVADENSSSEAFHVTPVEMDFDLWWRTQLLPIQMAFVSTDGSNIKHRAVLLFDWANNLAVNGHTIHPELTSTVGFVASPSFDGLSPANKRSIGEGLDNWIWDLSIRQDDPQAFGTLHKVINEPLAAGEFNSFQ
jgi:hypothetical protein